MKNNPKKFNKKKKGFSLAELLIALLIISIVLAAMIPTVSRSSRANREQMWRWAGDTVAGAGGNINVRSAFFGLGFNQSVILGNNKRPLITAKDAFENTTRLGEDANELDLNDSMLADAGLQLDRDRLMIFNKTDGENSRQMKNAHISFFTNYQGTNEVNYAGALTLDPYNIALGRETLQGTIDPTAAAPVIHNTAIGHMSQYSNETASENVSLGSKTLFSNRGGNSNVAVGYDALFSLQDFADGTHSDQNVAGGYKSGFDLKSGLNNVILGANALSRINSGINNVIIGSSACYKRGSTKSINNTICLGYESGSKATTSTNVDYGLYIGTPGADSASGDWIVGRTQYASDTGSGKYDKSIAFNVKNFDIEPFDGGIVMKRFTAAKGYPGGDFQGYGNSVENNKYFGFDKTVYYSQPGNTNESALMLKAGKYGSAMLGEDEIAVTSSFLGNEALGVLSYNDELELEMKTPEGSGSANDTEIRSRGPLGIKSENYELRLSHRNFGKNDRSYLEGKYTKFVSGNYNWTSSNNVADGLYFTVQDATSYDFVLRNDTTNVGYGYTLRASFINLKNMINIDVSGPYSPAIIMGKNLGNPVITLDGKNGIIKANDLKYESAPASGLPNNVKDIIRNFVNRTDALTSVPSDSRLKNIKGDYKAGLKEINQIEVKDYTYKDDKKQEPHTGVIAQNLQKIFPDSVIKDDKGFLRIKTEEMFYAAINAVKELYVKIQGLFAEITGLEKEISGLKEENIQLVKQNAEFEKRIAALEAKKAKKKEISEHRVK